MEETTHPQSHAIATSNELRRLAAANIHWTAGQKTATTHLQAYATTTATDLSRPQRRCPINTSQQSNTKNANGLKEQQNTPLPAHTGQHRNSKETSMAKDTARASLFSPIVRPNDAAVSLYWPVEQH